MHHELDPLLHLLDSQHPPVEVLSGVVKTINQFEFSITCEDLELYFLLHTVGLTLLKVWF